MLDAGRIADLLLPFFGGTRVSADLAVQLQTYLELLLRWNARMNLTAVRDPQQIVTRHFGESLFAARLLRDAGAFASGDGGPSPVADVGSGAGFPGVPCKLLVPGIRLTLIESHNKKATFLREVIRSLQLPDAEVFGGRADTWQKHATVVTLRAVERFASALPVAAGLVASGGVLCLLIGASQAAAVGKALTADWQIDEPVSTPPSDERVVVLARRRKLLSKS